MNRLINIFKKKNKFAGLLGTTKYREYLIERANYEARKRLIDAFHKKFGMEGCTVKEILEMK